MKDEPRLSAAARLALAAGLLGLAAGCGDVRVGPTNLDRYQPTDTGLFAGAGQLVLIGGEDANREALAEVAARNVSRGAMGRSGLVLTPNTGDERISNNRVVVVIGGGNPYALCDAPPAEGGRVEPGQPFSVTAAACSGARRLSSTSGRVGSPVTGPEDPKVAALFRAIGAELFPPSTPERDDLNDGPGGDWND